MNADEKQRLKRIVQRIRSSSRSTVKEYEFSHLIDERVEHIDATKVVESTEIPTFGDPGVKRFKHKGTTKSVENYEILMFGDHGIKISKRTGKTKWVKTNKIPTSGNQGVKESEHISASKSESNISHIGYRISHQNQSKSNEIPMFMDLASLDKRAKHISATKSVNTNKIRTFGDLDVLRPEHILAAKPVKPVKINKSPEVMLIDLTDSDETSQQIGTTKSVDTNKIPTFGDLGVIKSEHVLASKSMKSNENPEIMLIDLTDSDETSQQIGTAKSVDTNKIPMYGDLGVKESEHISASKSVKSNKIPFKNVCHTGAKHKVRRHQNKRRLVLCEISRKCQMYERIHKNDRSAVIEQIKKMDLANRIRVLSMSKDEEKASTKDIDFEDLMREKVNTNYLGIDRRELDFFYNWYGCNLNKMEALTMARINFNYAAGIEDVETAQKEEVANQNEEIPNQNEEMQNQNGGTQNKNEGMQNQNEGTQNKNEGTQNKNEGTQNKNEGTQNKNEGTQNKNEGMQNKNEDVQNQNEEVQSQNEKTCEPEKESTVDLPEMKTDEVNVVKTEANTPINVRIKLKPSYSRLSIDEMRKKSYEDLPCDITDDSDLDEMESEHLATPAPIPPVEPLQEKQSLQDRLQDLLRCIFEKDTTCPCSCTDATHVYPPVSTRVNQPVPTHVNQPVLTHENQPVQNGLSNLFKKIFEKENLRSRPCLQKDEDTRNQEIQALSKDDPSDSVKPPENSNENLGDSAKLPENSSENLSQADFISSPIHLAVCPDDDLGFSEQKDEELWSREIQALSEEILSDTINIPESFKVLSESDPQNTDQFISSPIDNDSKNIDKKVQKSHGRAFGRFNKVKMCTLNRRRFKDAIDFSDSFQPSTSAVSENLLKVNILPHWAKIAFCLEAERFSNLEHLPESSDTFPTLESNNTYSSVASKSSVPLLESSNETRPCESGDVIQPHEDGNTVHLFESTSAAQLHDIS